MSSIAVQLGSKRRVGFLVVVVFALSCGLAAVPILRDLGWRLADSYLHTTPPPHMPARPLLVLIDDKSLASEGRWPWSRTKLAKLVTSLSNAGAQVIGLDILLSEPQSPDADEQLASAMHESGRVVLVDKIASYGAGDVHWVEPLGAFREQAAGVGHAHALLDADGICRRFPAMELSIDGERLAFGIETAKHVDEQAVAEFLSYSGVSYNPGANVVVVKPTLIPIAFRADGFNTISAADVLRGSTLDMVRGRPVLVGFGSSDLGDRLSTPLTETAPNPGVEVHAQILDAVLNHRLLKPLPRWTAYVLVLATSVLGVVLFRTVRRWTAIVIIIAAAIAVYLAGWITYALTSWMLDPGPLLISLIVAPIAVQADYLFEVNRNLVHQVDDLRSWLRSYGRRTPSTSEHDLALNVNVLQQLQTELGSLYELHSTLMQASSDAIGVFGRDGRLLLQSNAFAALFGSAPYATKMSCVRSQLRWTSEAPEISSAQCTEGEARIGDVLYAVRTVEMAETRLAPGGGVLMLLTSLKTREERDASRAEALGFVAHELRAPLTSIQGFAELMMQHPELAAGRDAPAVIYRESKRLLALTRSYLDVLRVDAGARPIHLSTFAVSEVVENMLTVIRPAADAEGITLRCEGDPSAQISADRALIEGAILNLLTNAIKYGSPAGTITVSWTHVGSESTVTVCNPVEGEMGSEMSQLFSPFQRGQNTGTATGWGMGLALVKRIAEKHGGQVSAKSEQGSASFTVHLPMRAVAEVVTGKER